MKSELCIDNFKEIPVQEQQELNGGFWPIIAAIAAVVVEQVIEDWDNFKNGLMGRPEEKP